MLLIITVENYYLVDAISIIACKKLIKAISRVINNHMFITPLFVIRILFVVRKIDDNQSRSRGNVKQCNLSKDRRADKMLATPTRISPLSKANVKLTFYRLGDDCYCFLSLLLRR